MEPNKTVLLLLQATILHTASLIPKASKMEAPKLALNNPVKTTIVTARDTSATRIEAMALPVEV
jgi:hypothetical protein